MGEGKVLNLKSVRAASDAASGGEWMESTFGGRFFVKPLEKRSLLLKKERTEKFLRGKHSSLVKRDAPLPFHLEMECWQRAYVGTILLAWEKVEKEEGVPEPLTDDSFVELCQTQGLEGLFGEIGSFVNSKSEAHEESLKAHAGNS